MPDHWHPNGGKTPREPRTVTLSEVIAEAWALLGAGDQLALPIELAG